MRKMIHPIQALLAVTFMAAGFLALGVQEARAIDVCGNGICASTARPPETCSTCPEDCGPCPPPPPPAVLVVNMIPFAQSAETGQDSEPNLSVNPNNLQQIAGSAFTTNPTGSTTTAPIYVSTNGGTTWTMNNIVPSANGSTGDITLRFGGTTNFLYTGTLRGGAGLTLNLLRTANFTAATTMTLLSSRANVDQPFVQAATFAGADRVYVGNNDFNAAGGRTATVDRTLSGTAASPSFTSLRIETRNTCSQDGPPIRPAIHPDGTVYGIFYRFRPPSCSSPFTTDVVVVRDDNG
ncbi:MAG: hypothetical protein JF614_26460 [Acidobacteria bacterium]|nr:hypothetical protein [Acidobacteriota bacterium]